MLSRGTVGSGEQFSFNFEAIKHEKESFIRYPIAEKRVQWNDFEKFQYLMKHSIEYKGINIDQYFKMNVTLKLF